MSFTVCYFVDVEEILTKDGKLEIVYHRPNGYTPLLELKEYADFYKLDIVNRLPFIIANDTNIELSTFVTTILKHPINTFLEIIQSTYMIPFFIVQIIVLIVLFVFLHPTKRQPFEVVGKTNPVHGSAYWGEESEINAPKNVHLIPEKSMKKILEKSMRRGKMTSLLAESDGLILGKFPSGKVVIQPEDSKISNRNIFVVGGPGSFKTQTLLLVY